MGVVGITDARGHVATMSASVARKMSEAATIGVEIAGAIANSIAQDHAQLQAMVGGNFTASPRLGVQVGFSIDR